MSRVIWGFCPRTGAVKQYCHCSVCHPEEYEQSPVMPLRRRSDDYMTTEKVTYTSDPSDESDEPAHSLRVNIAVILGLSIVAWLIVLLIGRIIWQGIAALM